MICWVKVLVVERLLSIQGNAGDVYTSIDKNEYNCIIWSDVNTRMMFFISANMSRNELVSLAENLSEK